jgi:hypothetical protein
VKDFWGSKGHFNLWRYIFAINLQKKRERGQPDLHMPMGCTSIHLWNNRPREYMSLWLSSSNKGWHKQWFYLKSDTDVPLPVFFRRLIEETPEQWGWGVPSSRQGHEED